jgi:DNA-binding transcriptional LysR family regulator
VERRGLACRECLFARAKAGTRGAVAGVWPPSASSIGNELMHVGAGQRRQVAARLVCVKGMVMLRALRVGEFWNWLPTFRAVAEASSLRDAAQRLHVAPSAISRTVRLLEESLGHTLFERSAGTLVLNADGRRLLDGVRSAMRLIDEAQDASERSAPCHVHCPTDLTPLLLDAFAMWSEAHPEAPLLVHTPCAEDVSAQLLRGDLDVAVTFGAATDVGISSVLLGEFSSSVYCAAAHPASKLSRLTEDHLATLPFIDYPVGELHFLRVMRDQNRQRAAYVPSMALAVRMCARGVALVCVPDFVADARLTRLSCDLPCARMHASFRRPVEGSGTPAIVEHLASQRVFSTLVKPAPEPRRPTATREG